MSKKIRIVIVGAGFGGVYTYKNLCRLFSKDDIEIIVIDRDNHFLFTPLLHEFATGGLSGESITEPFRSIVDPQRGDFFMAEVEKIDNEQKIVHTSLGNIEYDYLVVSSGARTNFFGTKGADEHCFTLKKIHEALRLKNHFIDQFEKASKVDDEMDRKKMLRFVIVGGGPTGVEIACEMADYFYHVLVKKYSKNILDALEIMLVQRGEELVPPFPKPFRKKSLEVLKKKNVNVIFGSAVTEVGKEFVVLNEKKTIATQTSIWVAGVKPNEIPFTSAPKAVRGKVTVNEFLQLTEYSEIYALGDVSYCTNPGSDTPLPALAQVATRQAQVVAKNISAQVNKKTQTKFVYKSAGTLMSLGHFNAAAQVKGVFFSGIFAWFFWRTVYLSKHITFTKRVKVAFDWFIELFSERDITKIE